MTTSNLTVSSRNLSEDCGKIVPDSVISETPILSADLLENLRRFASIPSMDLVGVDASLSLKGKGREFLITNEGGQLFMVQAPAATNSPVARSPEEVVQFLDEEFALPVAEVEEDEIVLRAPTTRDKLGSPKLLIGLLALWAVVFFLVKGPSGIEGVTMIKDAARTANFAEQFKGRYGAEKPAGATLLVVDERRVRVFLANETGVEDQPILDKDYAFGERDGRVVLVVENGAILERDESGALVFDEEVYPRIR